MSHTNPTVQQNLASSWNTRWWLVLGRIHSLSGSGSDPRSNRKNGPDPQSGTRVFNNNKSTWMLIIVFLFLFTTKEEKKIIRHLNYWKKIHISIKLLKKKKFVHFYILFFLSNSKWNKKNDKKENKKLKNGSWIWRIWSTPRSTFRKTDLITDPAPTQHCWWLILSWTNITNFDENCPVLQKNLVSTRLFVSQGYIFVIWQSVTYGKPYRTWTLIYCIVRTSRQIYQAFY